MMKQTGYLNNYARKSGLQFLRQSAFQTHRCWRGPMTAPTSYGHVTKLQRDDGLLSEPTTGSW